MLGNKPEIWDYVDLFLLHLAKLKRRKLGSIADQGGFYEEFFTENDVAVSYSGVDRRRRYRGDLLKAACSKVAADAKVLDVGCGIGDNLSCILGGNRRLYGIEYSRASAEIARKVLPASVDIAVATATDIPYPDGFFDAAMCIEVLEHVPDQYSALREINRILKSGGLLVLSVPFRCWFRSYYSLMGHIRHYTRTDLGELLEQHGFEILEFIPNYPRWSRFANYCYVICRILAVGMRLVGVRKAAVELRLPFANKLLLDALFDAIEPIRQREHAVEYRMHETSTFVLARRIH